VTDRPLCCNESLRANFLSNRVFDDYDSIIDVACEAWRKLLAQLKTSV
jgi:hypothetical protein